MPVARILVVDDQLALRNLLQKYLERMGVEVEAFSDPQAALERFRAPAPKFRRVLADRSMPALSGEDLLRAMLGSDPHVRGILCSGFPVGGTLLEAEYPGRTEFLQKPFPPRALAEIIQKLLGAPEASGVS